jgi:predicted nucleotidyltransferase component of viral defense system
LSGDLPQDLRAVVDFFGLPNSGTVAKDWHVVRAIRAIAIIDAPPLALIFAGGTALARAHKLVQRMSEDVDFKVILPPDATLSRNGQRKRLGTLHDQVTTGLRDAGFKDAPAIRGGDENRYADFDLPYDAAGAGNGLRPAIKIEMTFARLRLPPVMLPVSSFVAEALGRPPEVPAIACASLTETAAEKLIALTRRTAKELAGLESKPDPTLVRHIYDLHVLMREVDAAAVIEIARDIARTDAAEFRNQYPAYADDIAGETRKAMATLRNNATRSRYEHFLSLMVYGERPGFDEALGTVESLTEKLLQ